MSIFKRNEYFGSILYDTVYKTYYYCDEFTTFLIDNRFIQKNTAVLNDSILQKFGVTKEEYESTLADLYDLTKNIEINDIGNNVKENMLSAPLRVFLDYTYECNMRCKHCFTSSGNKKNAELSLNEKKKIINQMVDMGSYRISLAGGEPLTSKDFFTFVEYARNKEIDVSFTTNGTLITKDVIDQLNNLQIRTVTVSLDGANEEDNDIIRGKGSFNKVLKNLGLLSEFYEGSVALRMTMMKHNIGKADDFIRLAEKYGCKKVKFNAMRLTGRAEDNLEFLLSPSEYVDFVHRMELRNNLGVHNKVKMVLPLNPFQKDTYDYIEELGFGCVAGKDCMSISPEGFVRPCSQLDFSYSDGNCKTSSLMDIWENGAVFNSYRFLEGNSECKNCEVYDKCRGGCRYRALQAGDINGIDPYCYIKEHNGGLSYDVNY